MRLCKALLVPPSEARLTAATNAGDVRVGVVEDDRVRFLDLTRLPAVRTLSDVLHAGDPAGLARSLLGDAEVALSDVTLLAPVDQQDVWAAGVTYKRSQEARERESVGAAQFYHMVYDADRPELFFKSTAARVVGPGGTVRIRQDTKWSVPEPELTLVISPALRVVGYTIGNDMSARDIEGENPLYLPQAKCYDGACAVGPVVTLAPSLPPVDRVEIRLVISRGGTVVFDGSTPLTRLKRTPTDLVQWLGKDQTFPHGVLLLTGTGIVPPDHFTLAGGDEVAIEITGVGTLRNTVGQGPVR